MSNRNRIRRITLMILGVAFLLFITWGNVQAARADDTSVGASVTITGEAAESYGGSVVTAESVLFPHHTLGEPDNRGAYLYREASLVIELENPVSSCDTLSVWAARRSFWSPEFTVYISADYASWQEVGTVKCSSVRYTRFDFTGSYGEVRYVWIDVSKQPRRFNMFAIDAVWAKGGEN